MKVKHRVKSLLNRRVSLSELFSLAIRCVSTFILLQFFLQKTFWSKKKLSFDLCNIQDQLMSAGPVKIILLQSSDSQ